MQNIELRFNSTSLISDENGEMTITGYINKTEQYSHLLGVRKKFKEKIEKGCFKRALERATDINLLYEHNPKAILSSTKGGHMTLEEDDIGLKITAKIVPTSLGKDVHELVKSQIVTGCSFGFRMLKDSWKKLSDGTYLRSIQDLDLFEVTICENGAYPQGLVSARGLNVIEDVEIPDDVEEIEEARDLDEAAEDLEERATDKTDELLAVVNKLLEQNTELISALKFKNEPIKEQVEEVVEDVKEDISQEQDSQEEKTDEATNEEVIKETEEAEKKVTEEEVTEETKEENSNVEETTEEETTEEKAEVDLSAYQNIINSLKETNDED